MTSQQKRTMRLGISHLLLVALLVLVLAPYLMVISASLRRGNFVPIGLLPGQVGLEHWKYVLGIPIRR
jgi:maltose/maltodextrin transport system permease protein